MWECFKPATCDYNFSVSCSRLETINNKLTGMDLLYCNVYTDTFYTSFANLGPSWNFHQDECLLYPKKYIWILKVSNMYEISFPSLKSESESEYLFRVRNFPFFLLLFFTSIWIVHHMIQIFILYNGGLLFIFVTQ